MGVLSAAIQVMVYMALGFLCRKLKWTTKGSLGSLTKILLNIAVPCLIINSMMTPFESEKLSQGFMSLVMILIIDVFFFASGFVSGHVLKPRDPQCRAVIQAFLLFNNFMLIGIPIIEAVLGPDGVFYTGLMGLPQRIIMFIVLPIMYGKVGNGEHHEEFSWRLLIQLPSIAVFVGLFLFITELRPPQIIWDCIADLGGMTMPLGMMITGMQLADVNIKELLSDFTLPVIVVIKNIINPAIVLIVLKLLGFSELLVNLGVLFAAVPSAAMTAIYAANYEAAPCYAGAAVFISTLFGVVTMPFWSYVVTII
ncbi:MAG: AEC family transporter [Oscillospiraceae bacterium]